MDHHTTVSAHKANSTDLSNQNISSLRGFDELQRVRRIAHLDLSRNPLRNLEHIASSNALQSLNLSHTDITSFFGAKPQPALREISLKNTPISHSPLYRVTCLLAFGPKLRYIDGIAVSSSERDSAFRFGADAAVAVSFGWVPPDTVDRSAEDYAKIVRSLHTERKISLANSSSATTTTAATISLSTIVEKLFRQQPQQQQDSLSSNTADGGFFAPNSSSVVHTSSSPQPPPHHHDHFVQQSGNIVLNIPDATLVHDKDAEISALQSKIKELEDTIKKYSLQQHPSGEDANNNKAELKAGAHVLPSPSPNPQPQQQQQQQSYHTMKVPGLVPSEIETIDMITWSAPLATIYSFVVDLSQQVQNPNPNQQLLDASNQFPQSVALSLSRNTLEIQRLVSRQAAFRRNSTQLAKVEGAEVCSSSSLSAKGPFKSVASLRLHFSDASSALLLFTSKTCMSAVFKALKFRTKNLAKTISFTFDADLESLAEFIAPSRTSDDVIDLFEHTTKQLQQIQHETTKRLSSLAAATGTANDGSPRFALISASSPSFAVSFNKYQSPGAASLSSPNWGNNSSTTSATGGGGGTNLQQQQQQQQQGSIKINTSTTTTTNNNSNNFVNPPGGSSANSGRNSTSAAMTSKPSSARGAASKFNATDSRNNRPITPVDDNVRGATDTRAAETGKKEHSRTYKPSEASSSGTTTNGTPSVSQVVDDGMNQSGISNNNNNNNNNNKNNNNNSNPSRQQNVPPISAKPVQLKTKNSDSDSQSGDDDDVGDEQHDDGSFNLEENDDEKGDTNKTQNIPRAFAINVIPPPSKAKKHKHHGSDNDDDTSSDENERRIIKPTTVVGLRAPGGSAFVIPTAVKVGRTTPSTVTPRIPVSPSDQNAPGIAAGGGAGCGSSSSGPSSSAATPVMIGNFKGRAIVVANAKKADSDEDSDSDDDGGDDK